ncbi:MAG: hypothetical protein P9E24_01215 [Candidatus Competibacter sp.]|nr:hypothetical protein [Candidatus Competibacter sp.]MDG4583371.1 hypothetical protein [Candidatus Competibacter sp.]
MSRHRKLDTVRALAASVWRPEPLDVTAPTVVAVVPPADVLEESPLAVPRFDADKPWWPRDEDEIDLPSETPEPRVDGLPHQLYIGSVRAERHGPTGPFDIDVTVEPRGDDGEKDLIWVGMARFERIEALRLCNFLVRALRRDAP